MTKRKASLTKLVDSSNASIVIPKEEFAEKINMRIKIGKEFLDRQIQTQSQLTIASKEYEIWNDQNSVLLKLSFNEPDNEYREGYDYINIKSTFFRDGSIEEDRDILFIDLRNKIEFLSKLVEKLPRIKYNPQKLFPQQPKKNEISLDDKVEGQKETHQQTKKNEIFLSHKAEELTEIHQQTKKDEINSNNKVIVVNGYDGEVNLNVERTLRKLGIEPIVLNEKGNEKITDAAFAIIILTDDDVGKAQRDKELNSRAAQNVILELGYFIGKLGINRVCVLYNNKVELPGDKRDITYIPFDPSEHWQIDLAKKIKAAGYKIDINNII